MPPSTGPGLLYRSDDKGDQTKLTRDGQFLLDGAGNLIACSTGAGNKNVLDVDGNAHQTRPVACGPANRHRARMGLDQARMINWSPGLVWSTCLIRRNSKTRAATLLSYPDPKQFHPRRPASSAGNLSKTPTSIPTTELSALMDAQRQLEANANMIHYQDSTLDKLVNTVGRIS